MYQVDSASIGLSADAIRLRSASVTTVPSAQWRNKLRLICRVDEGVVVAVELLFEDVEVAAANA